MKQDKKNKRRNKRFSIRRKIFGTNSTPRLAIFRSNREIYVQIIDDTKGNTLVAASSKDTSLENKKKLTKIEKAKMVGTLIGSKAKDIGIKAVVFDRGGFLYHGRVKALAEGARESGLNF